MAAYSFLISLERTIHRLLNSEDVAIESREVEIECAYAAVSSLQEDFETLDHKSRRSSSSSIRRAMLNDLDGEIREAVCRFEDVLQTHLLNPLFSRSTESFGDEKYLPIPFSIAGLSELQQSIDSLTRIGRKLRLLIYQKAFLKARGLLTGAESKLKTISLYALYWEDGRDITMIAEAIFEDVHISELFDCRAWVTPSLRNRFREIAVAILAQIHHPGDFILNKEARDDEEIGEYLKDCLKGRRYLIVLDNITDYDAWYYLKRALPDNDNGSRVLLTTPGEEIAQVNLEINIHDLDENEIAEEDTNFNERAKEISGNTKDLQVRNLLELPDEVKTIKDMLLGGPEFGIVSIVGMAGIGKTTLAREVFEDSSISDYFDIRLWVTLGPERQSELTQADFVPHGNKIGPQGLERLGFSLYNCLAGKKYLIVLDDLWILGPSVYKNPSLPRASNGSRLLLTTRLREEKTFRVKNLMVHHKRFLKEEESWQLLHQKVFGQGSCRPELEEAGKKIAKRCEGLPLTIVTVADILSKEVKTAEYWNKVAERKNSVFKDAYGQMEKILYPSYEYLPPNSKTCFLYMGVFPLTHKVPVSKLIKLWSSEDFLVPDHSSPFKDFVLKCLEKLDSRSLLMVNGKNYNDQIKTCWLHSAFWHLAMTEAEKNKFFHHLNRFVDGLSEGMKGHRRLSVHYNVLFGIKDVRDALASISTFRSLLCTGPHHKYPVPICFNCILLKILDALTIRFYEFPVEVVKLVHLRYLALTCNGKLTRSISKLLTLEFLIVRQHLSIKIPRDWAYLPMEIWDMKALNHLQVMGSNLPDPCGPFLLNLYTLLDVSARSCTKAVLKRIPNLKKFGIQIELAPDVVEPLSCLNRISRLRKLESFKCVIVNPELNSEVVALPAPLSMFPSRLKKLSLSGFAYPWEYMTTIALLPKLEVLKLRCYAFRGPKWVTHKGEFKKLRYLLLEDTDLVCWRAEAECCPVLAYLIIRHCYKLNEIPSESLSHIKKMDIVCYDPSISTQMEEDEEET